VDVSVIISDKNKLYSAIRKGTAQIRILGGMEILSGMKSRVLEQYHSMEKSCIYKIVYI